MRHPTQIRADIEKAEKLLAFQEQRLRTARDDLDKYQVELMYAYKERGLCSCGKMKQEECKCCAFASSEEGYYQKEGNVFNSPNGWIVDGAVRVTFPIMKDSTAKCEPISDNPLVFGDIL